MERVDFKFKNGHVRIMAMRQAQILGKLGHGTYQTRMLVAEQPVAPAMAPVAPVVPVAQEPQNEPQVSEASVGDDLEGMDKEQLHALAKERGVKVHHMAGAEKVRAALREAAQ